METPKTETETMTLPVGLMGAIVEYLSTRPFREVVGLMVRINECRPVADVPSAEFEPNIANGADHHVDGNQS